MAQEQSSPTPSAVVCAWELIGDRPGPCWSAAAVRPGARQIAVAVSGGPDSLTLAILADRWARERGGEICALKKVKFISCLAFDTKKPRKPRPNLELSLRIVQEGEYEL